MPKLTKKQTELIASREAGFVLQAEALALLAGCISYSPEELLALHAAGHTIGAKDLGMLADLWRITQSQRLAADKEADKLKVAETAMSVCLAEQMKKQDIAAIGGKEVIVEWREEMVPTVTDWDKYYAYVLSENDFSLLERRPGRAAIKERWEDGVAVPGVTKFPVLKLSRKQVKG